MTEDLEIGRFTEVDDSGMTGLLVGFLDFFEQVPGMASLRQRSYELLGAPRGAPVVDVGCGTGTAVAEMAALGLGSIGLDASEQLVAVASRRHGDLDLRVGQAQSLPFDAGSITGYRAERVFQHIPDPDMALAEARRVLAPGGRIVLLDFDVEMWCADTDDLAVTRSLTEGFAATLANPRIGRAYRARLLDAGYTGVEVEMRPLVFTDFAHVGPLVQAMALVSVGGGTTTQADADGWLADQEARCARDRMFMAVPMFVASATAPG